MTACPQCSAPPRWFCCATGGPSFQTPGCAHRPATCPHCAHLGQPAEAPSATSAAEAPDPFEVAARAGAEAAGVAWTPEIAADAIKVARAIDLAVQADERFVRAVLISLGHEAPAVEAPAVEAPAVEAPAVEAPAAEAPAVESPAAEAPSATSAKAKRAAAAKAARAGGK